MSIVISGVTSQVNIWGKPRGCGEQTVPRAGGGEHRRHVSVDNGGAQLCSTITASAAARCWLWPGCSLAPCPLPSAQKLCLYHPGCCRALALAELEPETPPLAQKSGGDTCLLCPPTHDLWWGGMDSGVKSGCGKHSYPHRELLNGLSYCHCTGSSHLGCVAFKGPLFQSFSSAWVEILSMAMLPGFRLCRSGGESGTSNFAPRAGVPLTHC